MLFAAGAKREFELSSVVKVMIVHKSLLSHMKRALLFSTLRVHPKVRSAGLLGLLVLVPVLS